jgi:hypothetical protein
MRGWGDVFAGLHRGYFLPRHRVATAIVLQARCTLAKEIVQIGGSVEFKRSAGVFVAGISFFFGGPLLSLVANLFLAWSASRGDDGMVAVFMGVVFIGGALALMGSVMLLMATHRALVKIDALPVRAPAASRQDRYAPTH